MSYIRTRLHDGQSRSAFGIRLPALSPEPASCALSSGVLAVSCVSSPSSLALARRPSISPAALPPLQLIHLAPGPPVNLPAQRTIDSKSESRPRLLVWSVGTQGMADSRQPLFHAMALCSMLQMASCVADSCGTGRLAFVYSLYVTSYVQVPCQTGPRQSSYSFTRLLFLFLSHFIYACPFSILSPLPAVPPPIRSATMARTSSSTALGEEHTRHRNPPLSHVSPDSMQETSARHLHKNHSCPFALIPHKGTNGKTGAHPTMYHSTRKGAFVSSRLWSQNRDATLWYSAGD